MNRLFLILLSALVALSFISCGDDQKNDNDTLNSDDDSSEVFTDTDSAAHEDTDPADENDTDSTGQNDADIDSYSDPCTNNPCNDLQCIAHADKFICSDPDKDYIWSDINDDAVLIDSAEKYCQNLSVSGYNDWQLPAIDNLREIIKNCPDNETDGSCNQTIDTEYAENCEGCEKTDDGKYSKLGDTGCLWASGITPYIWYVDYKSAYIAGEVESDGTIAATHHCNVRCVRYETGAQRTIGCKGPDNIKWNTAEEITQTWNGTEWEPTNTGVHNETSSETECRFICENATYNSESEECECNPGYKEENHKCAAIENPCVNESWRCHDLECIPSETSSGSKLYTGKFSCYDSETGTYWSRGFAKWNWDYSKTYCEDFTENGFDDWRLPTIAELRNLIKNCTNTETGGPCPITDETPFSEDLTCGGCEQVSDGSYSKLGDKFQLWSSVNSGEAFLVDFSKASIYKESPSFQAYPRCVRRDSD